MVVVIVFRVADLCEFGMEVLVFFFGYYWGYLLRLCMDIYVYMYICIIIL